MKLSAKQARALRAWRSIPGAIRTAVSGLSARSLGLRGGSEGWSIREYTHHLVEANLVVSNIVIAALGKPDCRYDWSWVNPDAGWMKRLGYDRAPIEPALALLELLRTHVTEVVRVAPGGMRRAVKLLDAPGAKPRRLTVEQVLAGEYEHAQHHLRDIADTRKAHGSRRTRARRGSGRRPLSSTP